MNKEITLRQANQEFSKVVQQVEQGASFVITRRGKPVARLSPVEAKRRLTVTQQAARRRALARMRAGWDLGGAKIDRDALHER
jgi:prevent-host-death family protein